MLIKEDFLDSVDSEDIKKKNYSFSAGQYFEAKVEYTILTPHEFAEKMDGFTTRLAEAFDESHRLEALIKKQLERIQYEK